MRAMAQAHGPDAHGTLLLLPTLPAARAGRGHSAGLGMAPLASMVTTLQSLALCAGGNATPSETTERP